MERDPQVQPVTPDYAPVVNTRRWCVIDIAVVTLAVLNLVVFATRYILPRVTSTSSCRPVSTARVKIRGFDSVLALYHFHLGAYPTSLDNLLVRPSGEAGAKWRGPYVEDAGTLKDAWGRPLCYKAPGVKNPGRYDLWSTGPDGMDGTKDDVKNW